MLNIFKKKSDKGKLNSKFEEIIIKIDGMHCTSCSMSVDGELEELDGVISAHTKYAKSISKVKYDPSLVQPEAFKKVIEGLGYKVNG